MDVITAIQTKRAVRAFTDQPIPDEVLRAILDAGRRAQSSKNDQPWQFVVVRDRATLAELATCGQYAGHLAGAAVGVALISAVPWAFDLGQAAAYMQLAAWSFGVGSCLASMWEPERARAILGIPDDRTFEIAISFGYPAEPPHVTPKPGGRRSLDDVVRWDRW